jgi:hypothetical protein
MTGSLAAYDYSNLCKRRRGGGAVDRLPDVGLNMIEDFLRGVKTAMLV